MKLFIAIAALFAASASNVMASGIVLCYDTAGAGVEAQRLPITPNPCATQLNFGVLPANDFLDWGLSPTIVSGQPYGLGAVTDVQFTYSPSGHGNADWNARSTGLVTAGLNVADGFTHRGYAPTPGCRNHRRFDRQPGPHHQRTF